MCSRQPADDDESHRMHGGGRSLADTHALLAGERQTRTGAAGMDAKHTPRPMKLPAAGLRSIDPAWKSRT